MIVRKLQRVALSPHLRAHHLDFPELNTQTTLFRKERPDMRCLPTRIENKCHVRVGGGGGRVPRTRCVRSPCSDSHSHGWLRFPFCTWLARMTSCDSPFVLCSPPCSALSLLAFRSFYSVRTAANIITSMVFLSFQMRLWFATSKGVFCGIAFHHLLVLWAVSVGNQGEFPVIAGELQANVDFFRSPELLCEQPPLAGPDWWHKFYQIWASTLWRTEQCYCRISTALVAQSWASKGRVPSWPKFVQNNSFGHYLVKQIFVRLYRTHCARGFSLQCCCQWCVSFLQANQAKKFAQCSDFCD